jgi:hypothetical protein
MNCKLKNPFDRDHISVPTEAQWYAAWIEESRLINDMKDFIDEDYKAQILSDSVFDGGLNRDHQVDPTCRDGDFCKTCPGKWMVATDTDVTDHGVNVEVTHPDNALPISYVFTAKDKGTSYYDEFVTGQVDTKDSKITLWGDNYRGKVV